MTKPYVDSNYFTTVFNFQIHVHAGFDHSEGLLALRHIGQMSNDEYC